jgi:AcrR family transcriptional regulator
MPKRNAREQLLERAIAHISDRGISDLSLRELGAAIGSSHRMLIHHFGSREGLWVEVIRAVEAQQRESLPELVPDPIVDPAGAMRAWWGHISDPSLWPNERLFFELYGQALQGRPGTEELFDGIVDSWLPPAVAIYLAYGMDEPAATAHARLGVAVTRGLLLDLLATRDRAAVDAAMERWIALTLAARAATTRPGG